MSDKPADYGREVRDTVVKSGLTGVAATVLAVTIFSPAGFGGLIGTSLASGLGLDPNAAAADDNPYASLPAFPSPLSQDELNAIHSQLARTAASLEITRAATDAKIEYIRSIALSDDAVTFQPMRSAQVGDGLRLTMSEPAPLPAVEPVQVEMIPVNYTSATITTEYRDANLELADLLLGTDSSF